MARSEDSLATLILTNRLSEVSGRPMTTSEFWSVFTRTNGSPSALWDDDTLNEEQRKRIDGLRESGPDLAFALESMSQQGIQALTPFDEGYPSRLSERLNGAAPPVIFVVGETSNLERPAIGIVGSRDIPHEAVEVVREAARLIASKGMAVVSGAARGVDQLAMATAFQSEGSVVGVLADSLSKRIRDADTRRAILDGRVTLISQQKPDLGFTVGGAMGRNKTIYALSEVTFIVASDLETGGTWAGATEALKHGYGKVAVWSGPGEGTGNAELIRQGGHPVDDVSQLIDLCADPDAKVETVDAIQLDMGL